MPSTQVFIGAEEEIRELLNCINNKRPNNRET